MAEVWKRPSLTAIEVLWRWAFWLPVLAICCWSAGVNTQNWQQSAATLGIALHGNFIVGFDPRGATRSSIVVLFLFALWAMLFAIGRKTVLRRLDTRLQSRWGTLTVLGFLRALSLCFVVGLWMVGVWSVAGLTLLTPLANDPAYVARFAAVVAMTLLLFVLWALVSWVLQIAPVLSMVRGLGLADSLRAAMRLGPVKSKLIEINLVMGIVKVALLVLAMVFSACPLPFQSAATQDFLNWWWAGVAVWYVVASDYFHVVRAAAYLRLWQAYQIVPAAPNPGAQPAS